MRSVLVAALMWQRQSEVLRPEKVVRSRIVQFARPRGGGRSGEIRGGLGRGGCRGLRLRCGWRRRVCRGWRLRGIWRCDRRCSGGLRFPCWRGRRLAFAELRARGGGAALGGRGGGGEAGGGAGRAGGVWAGRKKLKPAAPA